MRHSCLPAFKQIMFHSFISFSIKLLRYFAKLRNKSTSSCKASHQKHRHWLGRKIIETKLNPGRTLRCKSKDKRIQRILPCNSTYSRLGNRFLPTPTTYSSINNNVNVSKISFRLTKHSAHVAYKISGQYQSDFKNEETKIRVAKKKPTPYS